MVLIGGSCLRAVNATQHYCMNGNNVLVSLTKRLQKTQKEDILVVVSQWNCVVCVWFKPKMRGGYFFAGVYFVPVVDGFVWWTATAEDGVGCARKREKGEHP